jgi:hypothetical protein
MCQRDLILGQSDEQLLADCDVHIYKASGPGGQHRNKVSSAVRLRHRPTGISATANDSRSQHTNRRMAIRRLRMNIALRLRLPAPPGEAEIPPILAECLCAAKKKTSAAAKRLEIGRKDSRFWRVGALLLDRLDAAEGRLSPAAELLGISTGNLTAVLKADRHLLGEAQAIRKTHNQRPIS